MKLRCISNFIRLRLRRSDVASLAIHGVVQEILSFPTTPHFIFSIRIAEQTQITAQMINNHLEVMVPKHAFETWRTTNQVGMETLLELPSPKESLKILIEKDFPCAHRPEENKADTFDEGTLV